MRKGESQRNASISFVLFPDWPGWKQAASCSYRQKLAQPSWTPTPKVYLVKAMFTHHLINARTIKRDGQSASTAFIWPAGWELWPWETSHQENKNFISIQKSECCGCKNHDTHINKNHSRVKLYREKGWQWRPLLFQQGSSVCSRFPRLGHGSQVRLPGVWSPWLTTSFR